MTYPEPFRDMTGVDDTRTSDALHEGSAAIRKEAVPTAGPLMFLPFLVLFCVGLWLLGDGFERESGPLFVGGILVAGLAFLIPVGLLRD